MAARGGGVAVAALLRDCDLPAGEARILLGKALGVDQAWLIAHNDDVIDAAPAAAFGELCSRRRDGVPVAYLTGVREFYGLPIRVSPAVLIPRPETELLVDLALARMPEDHAPRVLDLGTGSGCVALAIAKNRPLANVTASDVSESALEVARENGAALALSVTWVRSDWYSAFVNEVFDLIVANPPYVAAGDAHLENGDLRFEPRIALTPALTPALAPAPAQGADAGDGLAAISAIVAGAAAHLAHGGWLLFEHGYDQAQACRAKLHDAQFTDVQSWRDLAGIERVSGGKHAEKAAKP